MAFLHARHMVINIGGQAGLLGITPPLLDVPSIVAKFRTRRTGDVVVVDACDIWCRKIRQVQWMPSQVDLLLGRALFPLSSTIVLFADHLGVKEAARVVAGLSRLTPYIPDLLPPSLAVLTTQDYTQEIFNSRVTDELYEMACIEHPQHGHTRKDIFEQWNSRVRSVQIIQKPPHKSWPSILRSAHLTTEERQNGDFGLSDRAFQRLCCHAIETYRDGGFNLWRACGISGQVTEAAKDHLERFINHLNGVKTVDAKIIASCLAINAYRADAYGESFHKLVHQALTAFGYWSSFTPWFGCRISE